MAGHPFPGGAGVDVTVCLATDTSVALVCLSVLCLAIHGEEFFWSILHLRAIQAWHGQKSKGAVIYSTITREWRGLGVEGPP